MAATRNEHGLTAKQERFAVLYATQGISKSEAYRRVYNTKAEGNALWVAACQLSQKPKVAIRIGQILAGMRVQDIVSGQQIVRGVLDDLEGARRAKNWTAAASLNDKLLKFQGLMTDRVAITDERAASDDDLVAYLAKGDEAKAAMVRQILGSADEFDA
jgi:hypothetical protein